MQTTTRAGSRTRPEPKVLFEIRKNAREIIRALRQRYMGRDVLDVRVWGVIPGGDYARTPTGFTVEAGRAAELAQGFDDARAAITAQTGVED